MYLYRVGLRVSRNSAIILNNITENMVDHFAHIEKHE